MSQNDLQLIDDKLATLKRQFENEIRAEQARLDQNLRNIAELKIATILVEVDTAMKKARAQYQAELIKADAYASIPELANAAKESAKRQLETSIEGYKAIAKQGIQSILDLAKR